MQDYHPPGFFLALIFIICSPIKPNFLNFLPITLSEMMGQMQLFHSLGSSYLTLNGVWQSLLSRNHCLPEIWSGITRILNPCSLPDIPRPDFSIFPVAKWISWDFQALRELNFRGLRERDTGVRFRLSEVISWLQNYVEHPSSGPHNPSLHLSSVMLSVWASLSL